MKRIFILFFFAFFNISYANNQTADNFIVFGDSLSDNGNNYWISGTGTPITSINEEGDRLIWIDYLAKKLFNKPAYSVRKAHEKNLFISSANVTYAYASADTSANFLAADWPEDISIPLVNADCKKAGLAKNPEGKVTSACVPGLLKQIDAYFDDINHKSNPNTLFFIWVGANDLFYQLPLNVSPREIILTAVRNIVNAKNKLIAAGISPERIYVLNLPDLSKTPYAISHNLKLREITLAFNAALEIGLTTKLNDTSAPLQSSHIISMFDLLDDVVANPTRYHVTNLQESCTQKMKMPLCPGYLFYDWKHPTSTVDRYIADYIAEKINTAKRPI